MRRTSLAALLAAPVLMAFPGSIQANPPQQCFAPFGFGGFCLGCFSKMHQHGPLFNYGPYYGYPPFEPYGPWNAYLQYNPWYYGQPGGGGHGHGHAPKDLAGHGGICKGGTGWHSSWGHGGWFHGSGCASCGGTKLFTGHGTPCSSCGSAAPGSIVGMSQTNPAYRLTGSGSPANSAVFYAGLPTIDSNITPVAGIAR